MISGAKIYCFSYFMCFCAIFFTYILLIHDAARQCPFLHFRAVACAFLSLMLVRRKILRLYFCLMAFIVKRHVCRHYAACKWVMRRRYIVTSVARLCLFGVALFFLTYFICADIFILYLCIRWAALGKLRTSSLSTRLHHLCIRWASARQCQVR